MFWRNGKTCNADKEQANEYFTGKINFKCNFKKNKFSHISYFYLKEENYLESNKMEKIITQRFSPSK